MNKINQIKKILETIESPEDIELVMEECIYYLNRNITKKVFLMLADDKNVAKKFIKNYGKN